MAAAAPAVPPPLGAPDVQQRLIAAIQAASARGNLDDAFVQQSLTQLERLFGVYQTGVADGFERVFESIAGVLARDPAVGQRTENAVTEQLGRLAELINNSTTELGQAITATTQAIGQGADQGGPGAQGRPGAPGTAGNLYPPPQAAAAPAPPAVAGTGNNLAGLFGGTRQRRTKRNRRKSRKHTKPARNKRKN